MKRQIKFRAWDNQAKKMSTTFNPLLGEEPTIYGEAIYSRDAEYMQFTGLQDKNGMDIYEGDILKVEWQKDSIRSYLQMSDSYTEYKEIVFVSYLKLSFVFILNNGKYFNLPKSCTITIIGNIYENPELLNTTENE